MIQTLEAFVKEAAERGARHHSVVVFGVYAGDKQTIKAVSFGDLAKFVKEHSDGQDLPVQALQGPGDLEDRLPGDPGEGPREALPEE